jgi:phenylalanyl-tRNA synthetase beta chain
MKVLLSWLREFVDVPASAEEIAALMGVRGFAVEGIEPFGPSAEGPAKADDSVIDFEVTANRPDCLSVVGIAREVATAYNLPLRAPGPASPGPGLLDRPPGPASPGPGLLDRRAGLAEGSPADIDIIIENPQLCPRYVGAVADVTIGPSPQWMQERLSAGGVRPISNIVDITNYVLLELGQPMHAFDHALLGGSQIRVRTARPGEALRTLDGEQRALSPEMLVIADATEPIAIAGVKGGAKSEITAATTTIVFESAHFNPLSVRRTSKALGLKTDASTRFERGSDPGLPAVAMQRALELLTQIGAGTPRGAVVDCHPAPATPRVLLLRRAKLDGLLGTFVPDADVLRILVRLGFTVGFERDGWDVTVPTRRVDVLREVDLIEDVARHYGFDRIPSTFPALTKAPRPSDPRIALARQLRACLTGAGFYEAVTFGFIGETAAAPFATGGDLVAIANPLSENFAVLRPSMLPGLIAGVAHNRRRAQRDVRLFEIGTLFSRAAGERRALACAWTGDAGGGAGGGHWSGAARDVDFFDMLGLVERVCRGLGLTMRTEPHREGWLVAGRAAAVLVNDRRIGVFGQLTASVAEQHGLAGADGVYVAEIDLDAADAAGNAATLQVEPLPRFPSVARDIAILVNDALAAADIRRTVRDAAPATLVSVREFDRYQGKGVAEGQVSLALRLMFRAPDRTLTDAEVQSAMESVLSSLKEKHGAVQR